jgi:hypothetical protein
LGLSSRAPIRFFRPPNCSGFGATATLALVGGLDEALTRDALGIYYGQCAGTMQAHIEAVSRRAARDAGAARTDLRRNRLFRRSTSSAASGASRHCRTKPFPSGRATQGRIDGLRRLIACMAWP